jgi:hypothetical protein
LFDGKHLTYAEPGHPEARRYATPQAVIVSTAHDEQFEAAVLEEQIR